VIMTPGPPHLAVWPWSFAQLGALPPRTDEDGMG
jgi:hypothetical protein